MRQVGNIMLKGLAAVLPVGLTVYLVFLLGISIERVLRSVITALVPESWYLPGMGLVAGVTLLFFVGLAVNALIVRKLLQLGEYILERIPLVKSIYGALRDFMHYFSTNQERSDLKQVVMVTAGDFRAMGFLTRENLESLEGATLPEDTVAVYLPMSYQIGGYTLYLPRSMLEPVNLSVEDAMRWTLTAGLSGARSRSRSARSGSRAN
ncbi:MAG: DUF502 domain-containing protein [Proteobacteria bacterium]|nr:MAG: DUF502 domain-containing protein [Pseudomonadota bacterium]